MNSTNKKLIAVGGVLVVTAVLSVAGYWLVCMNRITNRTENEIQKSGVVVREKIDGASKKIAADYTAAKAATKAKYAEMKEKAAAMKAAAAASK